METSSKKFCSHVPAFIIALVEEQEDIGKGNFSEDEILWRHSVINICKFRMDGGDLLIHIPGETLSYALQTFGSWELLTLFSYFPHSHTFKV